MAHTIYENFVLSNLVEDMLNSHLDLQQFVTIDNGLVGEAGMKRVINRYTVSKNNTEKLTMGQGNSKSIAVTMTPEDYDIELAQNLFDYYDEQEMTDPNLVPVGMQGASADLYNTMNDDILTEYAKASLAITNAEMGFDMYADAIAKMKFEKMDGVKLFSFVSPDDTASLRKALKDDLKYVEANVRTGYIGTVAGVDIFTKADLAKGTVYVATKKAVTLFNKKGVEIEQDREPNTRYNKIYSRKYYICALTDERYVVKITLKSTTTTPSGGAG